MIKRSTRATSSRNMWKLWHLLIWTNCSKHSGCLSKSMWKDKEWVKRKEMSFCEDFKKKQFYTRMRFLVSCSIVHSDYGLLIWKCLTVSATEWYETNSIVNWDCVGRTFYSILNEAIRKDEVTLYIIIAVFLSKWVCFAGWDTEACSCSCTSNQWAVCCWTSVTSKNCFPSWRLGVSWSCDPKTTRRVFPCWTSIPCTNVSGEEIVTWYYMTYGSRSCEYVYRPHRLIKAQRRGFVVWHGMRIVVMRQWYGLFMLTLLEDTIQKNYANMPI